jgi:hypothetical protein
LIAAKAKSAFIENSFGVSGFYQRRYPGNRFLPFHLHNGTLDQTITALRTLIPIK